ncbi:MAG: nucleotidyltransferase [Halopseudomonas sp.]
MTVADDFKTFVEKLKVTNGDQISDRYGRITRALNRKYRGTESKTDNSLQVGSYGRFTAIKGISDLDMIYEMPTSQWDRFKEVGAGKQSALLQEIKAAIKESYPNTKMRGDGQVVVISFGNQEVEVVPGFRQTDDSYKYPDTKNGGKWKDTNPRAEIKAISEANKTTQNSRRLCKMVRAWKNRQGVNMGGLLIDTLVYNFFKSTDAYNCKGYKYYNQLCRDFFEFLANQEDQGYFKAPGSRQPVYVKSKFQRKAKKAYNLCLKAIEAEGQASANKKWKQIFGRNFPASTAVAVATEALAWRDTEEFIEDRYSVEIRYNMAIDCRIEQKGYQTRWLIQMLANKLPLLANKKLEFSVSSIDVPPPFKIEWKVLNQGSIAEQRDEIRGQIWKDTGHQKRSERTTFKGGHLVECYAIKDGLVVAMDSIDVPIR